MPCFLSDLAALALSQTLMKCSGKLVCERREGEELGWCFTVHVLTPIASFDCFPTDSTLPQSPNPPALSEGCGVAKAPAVARLGSQEFPSHLPTSRAASLLAPHLPHSPSNMPLWWMEMVRDKYLTDSSTGGADHGMTWIEAAYQTV